MSATYTPERPIFSIAITGWVIINRHESIVVVLIYGYILAMQSTRVLVPWLTSLRLCMTITCHQYINLTPIRSSPSHYKQSSYYSSCNLIIPSSKQKYRFPRKEPRVSKIVFDRHQSASFCSHSFLRCTDGNVWSESVRAAVQ